MKAQINNDFFTTVSNIYLPKTGTDIGNYTYALTFS